MSDIDESWPPIVQAAWKYHEAGGRGDAVIISRTDIDRNKLMTGDQWYSKFEKIAEESTRYSQAYDYLDEFCDAARRASSLDDATVEGTDDIQP